MFHKTVCCPVDIQNWSSVTPVEILDFIPVIVKGLVYIAKFAEASLFGLGPLVLVCLGTKR